MPSSSTLESPTVISNTLDSRSILELLPHRYPFLLVDRIDHYDLDTMTIRGIKNVTMNEPFFQGHFPDNPIFPGVLIVEALAQVGCILVQLTPQGKGKLGMLAGIDQMRFRQVVRPGDQLVVEVQIPKLRESMGKGNARAYVDNKLAAEGEILFMMVPRPDALQVQ